MRNIFLLGCIWVCLLSLPSSASEPLACRQLAQLVGMPEPVDLAKAQQLKSAAGTAAPLKHVARLSMAELLIRSGKFAEAWKEVVAVNGDLANSVSGVRLQQEKLKLWLLVEAGSDKAEDQLQTLVKLTINTSAADNDRQDASNFLGRLLCMLNQQPRGVSRPTLDRAKQLLESQPSKSAQSQFQAGWAEVEHYQEFLTATLGKCENASDVKSQADGVQRELKQAEDALLQIKKDLDEQQRLDKELDNERQKLVRSINGVKAEMKRETPGRPREPRLDLPRAPGRNANQTELQRYEIEVREERIRYRNAMQEFPLRMRQWEDADRLRRQNLSQQLSQLEPELQHAVGRARAQEDEVQVRQTAQRRSESSLTELRVKHSAVQSILSNTKDEPPKLEALQKPSFYPLLDYSRESIRLAKLVSK